MELTFGVLGVALEPSGPTLATFWLHLASFGGPWASKSHPTWATMAIKLTKQKHKNTERVFDVFEDWRLPSWCQSRFCDALEMKEETNASTFRVSMDPGSICCTWQAWLGGPRLRAYAQEVVKC